MVEVVPFKGLRYNTEKTGPFDQIIAPPYDVISPAVQDELYEKNPYNIVRLILNKETPEDTESSNRYTRSAKLYQQWISDNVLTQDNEACFYIYQQKYDFEGTRKYRIGVLARVRVEDFSQGNICPHEFTLAKAKQDRSALLRACKANFSPIFGLYSDPEKISDKIFEEITENPALAEITDQGIVHRFWKSSDPSVSQTLTDLFKDKKIVIADGHHRYETALEYYKENGNNVPDSAYAMMFLTNLESEFLTVYPIHRMIKTPAPFDLAKFLRDAKFYFDIQPLPLGQESRDTDIKRALEKEGSGSGTFCAYIGNGEAYLLKVKNPDAILSLLSSDESPLLKALDVAQLHTLAINTLLKIDTRASDKQQYVAYKVDRAETVKQIDSGEFDLAFFLNPTPVAEVRRLAESGVRLPQKATHFYPKLLSGLVINPLKI
jgi:uncharacterized protein (DUF1015 family)